MTHRLRTTVFRAAAVLCALLVPMAAAAQLPEGVATRSVEIFSNGTLLAGDLFWPTGWQEGQELPALVLCHGWGGTKGHLNQAYAPQFAAQGYFVLTFDYRGWGESDGRLVAVGEIPEPGPDGTVTVRAREIRQTVSPVERIEDIRAAISWLELEPGVDRERIGLWGTSFGGGNIVAVAAVDRRVKCVVSQVGDLNTRWGWVSATEAMLAEYTPVEGSSEELARLYDEVVQSLGERAGRVEKLLMQQKITLGADGLLSVAETATNESGVVSLVEDQNADLRRFYSILARTPERADEVYLVHRSWRARGLVDPFPQGIGYGTLPPMSGIADLTQMVQYAAVEMADTVEAPVLIIEAGKEELMDPAYGTGLLAEKLEARGVPVKREVFEGVSHFEIYRPPALERARTLALDWFNRYLKGQDAERAAVQRTMEAMAAAYAARDIDAYMSYISEDFSSRHYFDKEGFRAYLEQAWQELVWESSYDPAAIVVEGDTAHAISMSVSAMGRFPVRSNFKKEEDGVWRVVSYG